MHHNLRAKMFSKLLII